MAYQSAYHEDSDADDEYERSVITSPTLPPDIESSPTDSEPPSAEHTPTTYTHSRDSHSSPTGLITTWSADQCADFISGLGLEQYADIFIDESINGEALVDLHHDELKELGMKSVGHRLTLLKAVYDIKVKQNVTMDADHYVPLSADKGDQDAPPTQDDITRIIHIIQDRDAQLHATKAELRQLKDDLYRISEDNRKLREDMLGVVKMAKDRNQPLPTPSERDGENHISSPPAQQERSGSSLSRKFSTKKLFLGSAPKNPSPTIHEGRTLTDSSSLDPSAAAMAASSHLTASISGGSSQPATSPHNIPQPSPTSPAYSTQTTSRYTESRYNDHSHGQNTWSSSTLVDRDSRNTPAPLSSRPMRSAPTPTPDQNDPPLSGGSSSTATPGAPPSSSSNPQVEIFKSFRVSIDDPCHKVLPEALKRYNITADWRQYALYIVHGDQERCLGLEERPLTLFKQLDKEGRKPMFMLRKHAAPAVGHQRTVGQGNAYPVQGQGQQQDRWAGGGAVQLPGGVLFWVPEMKKENRRVAFAAPLTPERQRIFHFSSERKCTGREWSSSDETDDTILGSEIWRSPKKEHVHQRRARYAELVRERSHNLLQWRNGEETYRSPYGPVLHLGRFAPTTSAFAQIPGDAGKIANIMRSYYYGSHLAIGTGMGTAGSGAVFDGAASDVSGSTLVGSGDGNIFGRSVSLPIFWEKVKGLKSRSV